MAALHILDLEAAINFWRARAPSPDGITLSPEVRALAEAYAAMVWQRAETLEPEDMPAAAMDAWLAWYETMPDTPCIAICSTSQGDEVCKGCGRTFDEVQHWPSMGPVEKRATWQRITREGTAWRFTRYAERAAEGRDGAGGGLFGGGPRRARPAGPPRDGGEGGNGSGSGAGGAG